MVVGVKETNSHTLDPEGVTQSDLDTWQYDRIAAKFTPYAGPAIRFERQVIPIDGKQFLVFEIREFERAPVLCKKQYTVGGQVVLKEGGCYVRSARKPETSEVATYEDMMNLLELAIEKRLQQYVATANRAGLSLALATPTDQNQPIPSLPTSNRFNEELQGL